MYIWSKDEKLAVEVMIYVVDSKSHQCFNYCFIVMNSARTNSIIKW